jgi:hypothetical protein
MFFGLHLILGRDGNLLGFNQKLGNKGVSFKTKDITTALHNVASVSTGLSIEVLQALSAVNRTVAR